MTPGGAPSSPFRGTGSFDAAKQASLLFLVAGILNFATNHLPNAQYSTTNEWIGVGALAVVPLGWVLPWGRWPQRASLAYVGIFLALFETSAIWGTVPDQIYGIWFVVCFEWLGLHHAPRTAHAFGVPAAVAYVVPLAVEAEPSGEAIRTVVIAIPAAVVIGELLARTNTALRLARAAQEEASGLLAVAAVTDDLTGLGNRRHANQVLDGLEPDDGVLLLDLDHFKDVNDRLGHAAGDALLTEFGVFLAAHVRDAGEAGARSGGEVSHDDSPRAGEHRAARAAERLLDQWRANSPDVTFSIGLAVHRDDRSPWATLAEADAALYRAKADGRDRCVAAAAG